MAVCTLNDSSILNDLFIIDSLRIFNGHWALQLSLGAIMISHDYEYQIMSNNNFGCFDNVATNFQLTFYNFFTV